MPPSVDAVAGAAVAAAPDGELEAALAGESTTAATSAAFATRTIGRGAEVDVAVKDLAGRVVARVVGRDDATGDAVAKLLEGQLGGGHGHGFDSSVWASSGFLDLMSEPELIARHLRGTGPRRQDRRGSATLSQLMRSAADTRNSG